VATETPSDADLQRWRMESHALEQIRRLAGLDLEQTVRRRLGESSLVTLTVPDLLVLMSSDLLRTSG
jgi:hypothetical protein